MTETEKDKRGEKKISQGGRNRILPLHQTSTYSEGTNTHLCKPEMELEKEINFSGEENETVFQESKWGQVHTAGMEHR